jgi:6-phosphogluconolactonase (cycloisomerase 2 family)
MRYFPWKWTTAALGALALSAAAAGPAAASSPSASSSDPVVGHVYVDGNTAGANTVDAFARHADGTLTPLADSPFPAGGAGTGATIPSQGSTALTGNGRYLLVVDAGSNQISVLRVHANGSLSLVSVSGSGGSDPVSIAIHGHLVYVANASRERPNYTGFRLHHGSLTALAGSTVTLPDASQPGQVLFNSTGTNLVGVRVATSLIDSFSVGSGGRLTAAPGSPSAAQGPGPFGSAFRPTNPAQLFVSNAHGGAGNGTVSAFDVAADGTLNSIGSSPFADLQTAPCWVVITSDGSFLFADNTGSGSISRYRIAPDGGLTLLGSVSLGTGGSLDLAISSDGHALYALLSGTHSLAEFALQRDDLTPLGTVALPAGATGAGLAAN